MITTENEQNELNWMPEEQVSKLLGIRIKTIRERCRSGIYNYCIRREAHRLFYSIAVDSLPQNVKLKLNKEEPFTSRVYSEAPLWARLQADKYMFLIKSAQSLRGYALEEFINEWNLNNPEYKTSYPSFIRMKRRFNAEGINGLLARYGGTADRTIIKDDYYDYFKNLYLVEGAPSVKSCWEATLGYAIRTDKIDRKDFPSQTAFKRKIQREIPQQSLYLARYGETAWNRKFGCYIERDYSTITCNQVWVSDHAQIDIACLAPDGNVVFPWVTAWRDYKSGKWLGWILQCGHPNSDHIFQSFYYAAEEFGLPEDVIIDNGKDYRSKDFAGGRKFFNVETDKARTTSMLAELNVNVHFALPYNAQTKPIERDFLKIKELLSKRAIGYRGGNIVERPEKLSEEIKKGKIFVFDDFKKLFDDFIINILNKKPSEGKNLKGLAPNDLFNEEYTEKVTPSRDALKLFCMRTSRAFTIGRNGIKDRELGITYWADWMISKTGLKVYLRRDVKNYKEAWAFKSSNDEFVGTVTAVRAVAALYADEISREEFKEAMAIKKRNLKVAKEFIKQTREIPLQEQCENFKIVYAKPEKKANPKISKIANTNMDKAIRKNKEMLAEGKQDLSMFIDETNIQEEPLYLFETDKILDEELKGVAHGF